MACGCNQIPSSPNYIPPVNNQECAYTLEFLQTYLSFLQDNGFVQEASYVLSQINVYYQACNMFSTQIAEIHSRIS